MKPAEPVTSDKAPAAPPAAPDRDRRRIILKWSIFAAVTAVCVGLGLWTTYLVEQRLVIGEVREILPFLSLQRSANSGVAFGLLGGNLAVILPANAIAVLVVLGYVYMERRPILAGIGGGLIVGGSLGNIIQRLSGDGHVTDYLKFPYWPNYNLPDVFIVVGIAVIFLGLIVEGIRVLRAGHKAPASH
jgi:signal peptidase II